MVRYMFYRDEEPDAAMGFPLFAAACVLSFLAVFGFGIFNLSRARYQTAVPGLLTAAVVAILYLTALRVRRRYPVYFIGVLLIDAFVVFLIARSGGDISMLFWVFAVPITSFLLLGKNLGLISVSFTLAAALSVLLFRDRFGISGAPDLSSVAIVRFSIAYGISGALSLSFEVIRERRTREALQRQEELATANERIERLSMTDALTGLSNRLYFDQYMPREIKKALRYRTALSLVLCDIDHFKKVNDTYGHPIGDLVLKDVASTLTENVRSDIDWVARWGGEEFVLVLPHCSARDAGILCERIRQKLEKRAIPTGKGAVRITASFGVSELSERHNTIEDLYAVSDARLYQAKERGRNLIVSEVT